MDTAVSLSANRIPVYDARRNHETRGAFADAFASYSPEPETGCEKTRCFLGLWIRYNTLIKGVYLLFIKKYLLYL